MKSRNKKVLIIFACLLTLMITCLACTFVSRADVIETENPYYDIFAGMDDDDYRKLEQVIYWEAARAECPLEVEVAVVETVMNRVLADEWPNDVSEVCTKGHQFVCKSYKVENGTQAELISDAIVYVMENGPTVLPSCNYCYFATKMQSCAQNHIWVGDRKANGKPRKGKGMYFAEGK